MIEDLNEKAVNEPYILLYKSMGQSSQTVVEWACKFHIAEFNMSPIFFNGLDQGCFALRENIFMQQIDVSCSWSPDLHTFQEAF